MTENIYLIVITLFFIIVVLMSGIALTIFLILNRKDFKDKISFWEIFLIRELLFEPDRYIKPDKIDKFKRLKKILIYITILYLSIFFILILLTSILHK